MDRIVISARSGVLMNQFFKLALFSGTILFHVTAYSTTIPNTDHPLTFLGPTIKANFTNRLLDTTAYSLAGEIGAKNVRLGITYGMKFTEFQRIKISAEYLWQDIIFAFFSGNSHTWMNQGALGIAYQYDIFENAMRPQFDISAYGSRAPSKTLGSVTGSYINQQGNIVNFHDIRHIAGSNTAGISPGFGISIWPGSRITASLNYDNVHYNTRYQTNDNQSAGLGGTLGINQIFNDYIAFGMSAGVRKPFNYYDIDVKFFHIPFLGEWAIGLFGAYNMGKNSLPNTYNIGLTANYFIDQSHYDSVSLQGKIVSLPPTDKMLTFISTPAVYMPQVLAMADKGCAIPIAYLGTPNTIPPGFLVTTSPFSFAFAPLFKGEEKIYSVSTTASGGGSPSDFSINSSTGVLSYTGPGGVYHLTISARNSCSSSSVSFDYSN
jgi:hypothetical protein